MQSHQNFIELYKLINRKEQPNENHSVGCKKRASGTGENIVKDYNAKKENKDSRNYTNS